jgi:chorismate mutase/prephenate dehydratase
MRSQIDKLDHQIQKLLNTRADIASDLGQSKPDSNSSELFVPAKEEETIESLLSSNKGPLDPQTMRAIFRELISGSRALQKVLKVAYLGPEHGASHQAMIERFGMAVEGIAVGSISAVFEDVNRSHSDFGIVPLENSMDGRLSDTLELFARHSQIKIVSEVRLRVHHHLLSNSPQQEVRRVYSRSQALAQARNWLSKNLPHAQAVEVTSTAVAAELAGREPGAAAIAGRHAANRFGLKILFSDIEDSAIGESRYAVISLHSVHRTGRDRTAIVFHVRNNPGALADVLGVFKAAKININVIESLPKNDKADAVFFLDFDGHIEDPKIKRVVDALNRKAEKILHLGSFPMSEPVD